MISLPLPLGTRRSSSPLIQPSYSAESRLNRCLGHISQSQVFVVRELRLYWPDNALLWLLIPLSQLHGLFTHLLPGGFLLPPIFSKGDTEKCLAGGRERQMQLKNSVIWMQKISDEAQNNRHFTYKFAPELNSASVRIVRANYDSLRVLGSIEWLKRKWICPVKSSRVFQ